jgi:hypothetical protein
MGAEPTANLKVDLTELSVTAPTFLNAGVLISNAVAQAKSQLDGMGAFWGSDKAGENFANGSGGKGYAYYQPVLLNLIAVVAGEVEGISSGIQAMVARYSAVEGDNIQMANELRESIG